MTIKVLFFGATAEAVGEREVEFKLDGNARAEIVFAEILNAFPNLKEKLGNSLLFSVNQEYATGSETIHGGDELAVFTAVSGG